MTDKEIKDLQKELEILTLEFRSKTSDINRRLRIIREKQAIEEQSFHDARTEITDVNGEELVRPKSPIKKGDIVEIINEYRYIEKGVIGKVTKINAPGNRVWLTDKNKRVYIRAPDNLRKL